MLILLVPLLSHQLERLGFHSLPKLMLQVIPEHLSLPQSLFLLLPPLQLSKL